MVPMMRPSPRSFLLVVLLTTLFSTTPAHAGAKPFSERPVWLGLGGAGGISAGEVSGVAYFNLTLGLRLAPIVPEFTLRQGLRGKGSAEMQVGGVAVGARFLLPRLLATRGYFRLAFSQQHEVQWDHFLGAPMKTLFGVGEGLTHRSGFETGGGVELRLGPRGVVGFWAQGTLLVFPGTAGPPVTTVLEAGLSFSIGPKVGAG